MARSALTSMCSSTIHKTFVKLDAGFTALYLFIPFDHTSLAWKTQSKRSVQFRKTTYDSKFCDHQLLKFNRALKLLNSSCCSFKVDMEPFELWLRLFDKWSFFQFKHHSPLCLLTSLSTNKNRLIPFSLLFSSGGLPWCCLFSTL